MTKDTAKAEQDNARELRRCFDALLAAAKETEEVVFDNALSAAVKRAEKWLARQ